MNTVVATVRCSSLNSTLLAPRKIPLTPSERNWPARSYSILNEVLGPDFHGPSSSHTAAPQLIALVANREVGGIPDSVRVKLFNSFATTGEGHRTKIAVIAGLLGIDTTDPRTPGACAIARERGLDVQFSEVEDTAEHPNTIVLELTRGLVTFRMKGISIGGGNFEVVEKNRGNAIAA